MLPKPHEEALHHEAAAGGNIEATQRAISALSAALSQASDHDKILLRAAAGAGKSYALVRMVREALDHANCTRVAVTAFANKQVFPLAEDLGKALGADKVCLFVKADRIPGLPAEVLAHVAVAASSKDIPTTCSVVLGVSHKLGAQGEAGTARELPRAPPETGPCRLTSCSWTRRGNCRCTATPPSRDSLRFRSVSATSANSRPSTRARTLGAATLATTPTGPGPLRMRMTATSYVVDLPAVWRPTAAQLPLWRAFYGDWDSLNCVAAPGDRRIELPPLTGAAESVWEAVATGTPTLLEVDGLPAPDAPDIDPPLLGVVEELLMPLLEGGFATVAQRYDGVGRPEGRPDGHRTHPVRTHSS